jgi:hypothetical protein
LQKFKEYGLDAWIEEEEVLLSYPNSKATLDIIEPENMRYGRSLQILDLLFVSNFLKRFSASMEERYIKEDWTSDDSRIVPPFNGYAPSGDVTGQLVRNFRSK